MTEEEIKIVEMKEKAAWESFLLGCKEKTFLDSWNWGEFQKLIGNKIRRLGFYAGENLLGLALVAKIKAKRGAFLLIQHGPVITQNRWEDEADILNTLLKELKIIAKEEGADFIRINPLWERNRENLDILKSLGFREAPMHANAYEETWKLDIRPPEEDILKNMRKTTRYIIRRALKNNDILVERSGRLGDAEIYQKLNRENAQRQKFSPFSFEFIKNEFAVFSADKQALWFFGKYKDEITAAALVVFWQNIAFYHQAASLSDYAKLNIPYLVQWEAIREAKKRGCNQYDFWGYTDPQKYPAHPWAGPTLFKMGFGGYKKEYVKTQDLPLSKRYWLNYFFETMRRVKRGL